MSAKLHLSSCENFLQKKKIETDVYPIDEPNGDRIHRIIRTILGASPFLSGTAVEMFNALVIPPIEKRKAAWVQEVGKSLNDLLEKNVVTFEELENNEQLFDVLINASQAALKTHRKEKLKALRNAVLNTAINPCSNEDELEHFLLLIDYLSPIHLKIMNFFSGIYAGPKSGKELLPKHFGDWKERKDFYTQTWNDLIARGLIIETPNKGFGFQISCSLVAHRFLDFVKDEQIKD